MRQLKSISELDSEFERELRRDNKVNNFILIFSALLLIPASFMVFHLYKIGERASNFQKSSNFQNLGYEESKRVVSITESEYKLRCGKDNSYIFYSNEKGLFCDNLLNITTDYDSIVNVEMKDLTTNQLVGVNEIMTNN